MYKLVYDNIVIDFLKDVQYLRFLPKSKRVVLTDRTSAHCILGSDGKQIFHIEGRQRPNGCNYKSVRLVSIAQEEYDELSALVTAGRTVYADENLFKLARAEKIKEMSEACHQAIVGGVCVVFSDNKSHHFELTIEDQINLLTLKDLIAKGAREVVYHETNSLCRTYRSIDITKLIERAFAHKTYHTTYFNALKNYINNLCDVNAIMAIEYGASIPDQYCSDALKALL